MGAAAFGLVAIISSKILSYAYKIVAARYFGPEGYGSFSLAFIFLSFFTIVAALGIPDGLLRIIPSLRGLKKEKKIASLTNFSFRLIIVLGIASAVILFFGADWINRSFFQDASLTLHLKILALALPFSLLVSYYATILRSFEKVKTVSFFVNILPNALKIILLGALIFVGMSAFSISYAYTISFILIAVAMYIYSRKRFSFSKNGEKILPDSVEKAQLFKYSFPFIFIGLLNAIFYWTDSLMIGHFADARSVGLYSAALTVISLFSIGPDLFVQLFLPVVSKETAKNNSDLVRDLTKRISKWIYLVNLPIFLMILLFPSLIINILFGSDFLAAKNSLIILSLGAIISGIATLSTNLLSIKSKDTMKVMKLLILFSIVNISLNIFLIPLWGMEGAATATAISWALFSLSLALKIKKEYGFFPFTKGFPIITLIAVLSAGVLILIKKLFSYSIYGLFLAGAIFAITYLIILIATKSLDNEDKKAFFGTSVKLARALKGKSSFITKSSDN